MTLAQKVREATLGWVLHNRFLMLSDRETLVALVDAKIVTPADLLSHAKMRLVALGRACYVEHIQSIAKGRYIIWPDHTISPEAFAYALANNAFTKKEEVMIGFDHGDTKESFIAQYGIDTLPKRTVDGWLDTTPPP